jgi:hypothetical protein
MGNLEYLTHDADRQKPVWFQFQVSDFDPSSELYLQIQGGDVPANPKVEAQQIKLPTKVDPPVRSEPKISTRTFRARKIPDLSGKEARNKELGLRGEEFILQQEMERLTLRGRSDLANKIEHTSVKIGDGAGYDIKSYNEDGTHKFIEVKTTQGGIRTGFYISPNELAFAKLHQNNFILVRVFDFDLEQRTGHYFELDADLESHVSLIPVNYKAVF